MNIHNAQAYGNAESMVAVRGVSKQFRTRGGQSGTPKKTAAPRFTAVERVSFDVAPGEFVSLLGPSGSGKTTLLRIIGGLIGADSGEVQIAEIPVRSPRRDV